MKIDDPVTHYIVVRRDLPLGTMFAMVAHAAGESFGYIPFQEEPTTVVVLGVANRHVLENYAKRLRRAKVSHVAFREPDPPYNGQMMSIGIKPRRKSELYRYTKYMRLLRFPNDTRTRQTTR